MLSHFKPKILCAISHGIYEPWISILKNGQSATWLAEDFPENFRVLHFHASPVRGFWVVLDRFHEYLRWRSIWTARMLRILDNLFSIPFMNYIPKIVSSKLLDEKAPALHVLFPDTYVTYRWKFLSLLKYFVEQTEDDYLFVTTTASYVQPKMLLKHVENVPKKGVYAGAEPYPQANFISGSNRILSRDIAIQILANRTKWKTGTIEDVALADLVKSLGNRLDTFPILNISSLDELNRISDFQLLNSYHFRLKSGTLNNRNDVEIMTQLHSLIKNRKGSSHGE